MDPTATLQRLLEAIRNKDLEEAKITAREFADWLAGDGFLPSQDDLRHVCAKFAPPSVTGRPAPYAEPGQVTPPAASRAGWPYQPLEKPPGTIPHR
jgi:hypothetical protein